MPSRSRADLQQAAQQLAQHDLMVPQVGQQQQDEGAAVFLLGDGAGGRQGREKGDERPIAPG